MNDTTDPISSPLLKLASAWAAVGITSWSDFAAFVAAMYTLCLIGEFVWKKIIKPIAVREGWMTASVSDKDDAAE